MRVCILYDCLYPWTIGGAERWYRQLAEAHAARGHSVTYLTLRQWDAGGVPDLPGVEVIAVGPRLALYRDGKRRILPPLLFGLGVLWHLLRRGRRYDVVHGASFPFFSILAAGLVRPFGRYRIAVDWHEVWSRDYWREYLGPLGALGWFVQRLCAAVPQFAFSFSKLHASRAGALGLEDVTVLEGEYGGRGYSSAEAQDPPFALYMGRMIPEKRVPLLVDALAVAMQENACLQAVVLGQGPDLEEVRVRIFAHGLTDRIALPGFVSAEQLEHYQRSAAVIVQPSMREGYGMVVVEAAARGVPVVIVAGEDNAAVELVEQGVNGFIASSPDRLALADAIRAVLEEARPLRERTADWYARNAERLSFAHSFDRILTRIAPIARGAGA